MFIMRIFSAAALWVWLWAATAQPVFQYNTSFIGGSSLNVVQFSGRLEDRVAAINTTPIKYINASGDLECHVLWRIQGGQWHSFGDLGALGPNSCPLLNGATPIRAITAFGSDVCIGGDFTDLAGDPGLDFFACYSDSLGWYQPGGNGNGPNAPVHALASDALTLYIGGQFTAFNGGALNANRIVRSDGISYTPLYSDASQTTNGVNGTVTGILPTASFIVALVGTGTQTWNPAVPEWNDLGSHNGNAVGAPDAVLFGSTLTRSSKNATLIAGDSAGSVSEYTFGTDQWADVGLSQGIDTHFGQLAFGLGPLYATGDFTAIDPDARGLAWFNGVNWQAAPQFEQLGNLNIAQPLDMQQAEAEFCLLTQGAPLDATIHWSNQVCYNGSKWRGDVNAPLSNVVQTLHAHQGKIVHGGDFNVIGDQLSPFIGRLNFSDRWKGISQLAWQGAGQGHVSHLQAWGNDLYATGLFDLANGATVSGVARWDGVNWAPVTPGLSAFNGVMTVWNDRLIITGSAAAGGPVLQWDGAVISNLSGFPGAGQITDMAVYQNDLVVAHFVSGTGQLYRYDGVTWQAFGGTMVGAPLALAADGNNLYVGGSFTSACNGVDFITANNIYRWNGSGCDTLGTGVTNTGLTKEVRDIALRDGHVIVTGRFDQAGAVAANSLAIWDGTQWHALGQGLIGSNVSQGQGNALWLLDGRVYVAGYFEQAGDALSHHFAAIELILDRIYANGFE